NVVGNRGGRERPLLRVGVHQAQAVLARELPARARAAVRRPVGAGEVARAAVRLLAAPLALAEEDRLLRVDAEGRELVLEHEPAAILGRVGVRCGGIDVCLVEGNHREVSELAISSRSRAWGI